VSAGRTARPSPGIDERSRWTDLDGPVHYLDYGGPADGPVVVCVHGLGGAAVNWSAIAPLLTGRYRLVAPDLAGHGLTPAAGRGTGVTANRVLLHRFVAALPELLAGSVGSAGSAGSAGSFGSGGSVGSGGSARPVILMGNSMGGMISLLEAIAAPAGVARLVLLDPALPVVPARPDPAVTALFAAYTMPGLNRLAMYLRRRRSPEASVAATLSLCCVDPTRIPADVVAEHVEVARRRAAFTDVERDFLAAARSVVATAGFYGNPYRRGIRSITVPVLIVHGARDRLVPVAAARAAVRANPSWSLVVLPDVGHVPQLEAPRDTAAAILKWLEPTG
jgi:pimeloyl-ACP methyl ester carboxylesterase